MNTLMTRDEFRTAVFVRDAYRCVMCNDMGQDAHHIIERRLFPDGGYYLDNGATLCGRCHLKAESTEISCSDIRYRAGIEDVILPPHLYPSEVYDKWGNPCLPNGTRLKGELFEDTSVQKVLIPVLHLFTDRVKYPRTWHLPWSASVNPDDRVLSQDTINTWQGTEVVITEKMDGECTTMYHDGIHARSIDYEGHKSRDYVKAMHARIAHDIPVGWRVCGENLWAKHSIAYDKLPSYFMVFSVWDGLTCLSWDETEVYANLLGFPTVPVLGKGMWERNTPPFLPHLDMTKSEGYVIRPRDAFRLAQFRFKVGKYVRKDHVQTHGHWMRSAFTPNKLA
jgi:hypothetical protein